MSQDAVSDLRSRVAKLEREASQGMGGGNEMMQTLI